MKLMILFFLLNSLVFSQNSDWINYNISNSPFENNWISAIDIDQSGNKWFAIYGRGVGKFDGDDWTVYDTTHSFLPSSLAWTIRIDQDQTKWIGCGTNDGGLVKYDGVNRELYNMSNSGLPDNMVHSITFDEKRYMWIGTLQGGLARFDYEDE